MRRVPCGLSVIMGLRSAGGLKREQLRHATIVQRESSFGFSFWRDTSGPLADSAVEREDLLTHHVPRSSKPNGGNKMGSYHARWH